VSAISLPAPRLTADDVPESWFADVAPTTTAPNVETPPAHLWPDLPWTDAFSSADESSLFSALLSGTPMSGQSLPSTIVPTAISADFAALANFQNVLSGDDLRSASPSLRASVDESVLPTPESPASAASGAQKRGLKRGASFDKSSSAKQRCENCEACFSV